MSLRLQRARNATLATQGGSGLLRYVSNETELNTAIHELAYGSSTNTATSPTGGTIIVSDDFKVTKPVVIPATLGGLTVKSDGAEITCTANYLFQVNAPRLSVRGLVVTASTYIFDIPGVNTPDGQIRDCIFSSQYLSSSVANTATRWSFSGCKFTSTKTLNTAPYIQHGTQRWRFIGNEFLFNSITIDAGGGYWTITSNDFRATNITTTASGGFNVISSNCNCGTIAFAGTDQVGLNS